MGRPASSPCGGHKPDVTMPRDDTPRSNTSPEPPQASETSVRVVDRRWWARSDTPDGETARASDKPMYVQELEQRLESKDAELRDTIARYREAAAEFEEMRVRVRRDAARDAERGRRTALADFLEVIDNLDRALDAARSAGEAPALGQGVSLVRAQFLAKLEAHGVTRFDSLGQPFDPARHEAVSAVPVSTPADDGRIVGVVRDGYNIGSDLLRPAMVAVGRFIDQGAAS